MRQLLNERWGSTDVVSRGLLHDAFQLKGSVAIRNGEPVGLLTYRLDTNGLEVVTLDSMNPGRGIGTRLLKAARDVARNEGCRRLWLVTTNDNVDAQRFYMARGFKQIAVYHGAVLESRKLKAEIPLMGSNGIPINDEIEFELDLTDVTS